MAKTEGSSEQHPSATKIKQLASSKLAASKRNAAENGTVGAKIKALQEAHPGFSPQAFARVYHFWKMDPQKRAHELRAFDLYRDMLGLDEQGDLDLEMRERNQDEDGRDTRTPMERAMDGDPMTEEEKAKRAGTPPSPNGTGAVDSVLNGLPREQWRPDLVRFDESIREAINTDLVNTALDRFTLDFPDLAEMALELAQDRITQLNVELGGGTDMRPDALKRKDDQKAADTVAKAKEQAAAGQENGEKIAKGIKAKARPASPAAQAAADLGIGKGKTGGGKGGSNVVDLKAASPSKH